MNSTQIGTLLKRLWIEQDGVTSIEYALLAALIFGAIVTAVGNLGTSLHAFYDDVALKVADAML